MFKLKVAEDALNDLKRRETLKESNVWQTKQINFNKFSIKLLQEECYIKKLSDRNKKSKSDLDGYIVELSYVQETLKEMKKVVMEVWISYYFNLPWLIPMMF